MSSPSRLDQTIYNCIFCMRCMKRILFVDDNDDKERKNNTVEENYIP